MRGLIIALVLVVSASAHAQTLRPNQIPLAFTGGTLNAPLVVDATGTLCSGTLVFAFAGDLDTGMQRSAANTLLLCAGAAAGLTLTSTAATFVGTVTSTDSKAARFITTTQQTATCDTGAVTITPTSDLIAVVTGGVACVATISETGAQIGDTVRVFVSDSPGIGVVTFPNVANVFAAPTLCSTTGLGINGTLTMTYVDVANDLWVTTSCILN